MLKELWSVSPGASAVGGGKFRHSSPRSGKAFSVFLAEISVSTSLLPVLLLPVRLCLNPRNASAALGRAGAGRLLPLWRMKPCSSGAVSCKYKTKTSRKT